jgi:hypothetical protein
VIVNVTQSAKALETKVINSERSLQSDF